MIFNYVKYDNTLEIRCTFSMNRIMNALDLCLDITYLCFHKTFYLGIAKIFGVAMGSPISVIVANLVWRLLKIEC